MCAEAKLAHTLTTRKLAKFIGNLVASMEAVNYGRLFIGNLKEIKLNLFCRTRANLKQILHLNVSLKKSSIGGNLIL